MCRFGWRESFPIPHFEVRQHGVAFLISLRRDEMEEFLLSRMALNSNNVYSDRSFFLTTYRLVGMVGPMKTVPVVGHKSKLRILNAALAVIRAKGYAAATIDDICHRAVVTKGSFFHHFKSKDDLALAAVAYWETMTDSFFAAAPYRRLDDPFDRLIGYVDFRASILNGALYEYTCLLGTLVQETYDTHPQIRARCDLGMSNHIAELTKDVVEAKALYAPEAEWSAESVGYFIQSVLQGGFIFAKAKQSPGVVREDLSHLKRYLSILFGKISTTRERTQHGHLENKNQS
jgi:TetR/AcrR family transcriptional regulator, transcriptional repressor for nem operon